VEKAQKKIWKIHGWPERLNIDAKIMDLFSVKAHHRQYNERSHCAWNILATFVSKGTKTVDNAQGNKHIVAATQKRNCVTETTAALDRKHKDTFGNLFLMQCDRVPMHRPINTYTLKTLSDFSLNPIYPHNA
jgi:hypothetical protein